MNINIHNYETYFLLYIDNELSIAERAALEQFIEANPNYANELNALKNTVSETENITFKDKFLLYRWEEMEASIPSSFKHNLYREEAKIITGFFTRKQILTITSIAAVVLLLIGYPMFFDNVITNNNNGLVYNKLILLR
jgi:hypothetical protein